MFWIKRLNKGAFRMAALSAKLSFKKASPNVSFGSQAVITRADIRHPLVRDKQSSHVGFRRPIQFSAALFPQLGANPTLWSVADFVFK